jgi:hypothetical protein
MTVHLLHSGKNNKTDILEELGPICYKHLDGNTTQNIRLRIVDLHH